MKRLKMNRIVAFLLCLFLFINSFCQPGDKYSLLTQRYVERPLAMYKGQLQFTTGYEFSIISKKYDPDGEKIDLSQEGSVAARHMFPFTLKAGLLDYIQLTVATNYASMGVRSQNITTGSLGARLYQSEVKRYRGFDDLYLGMDLSAPFKTPFISWIVTAGIHFPVFNHEPDKPSHIYEIIDATTGSADLRYRHNLKFGSGIPLGLIGSSIKFRVEKFSLAGSFHYLGGMKEGESSDWNFRLVNNRFEFEKESYQYHPGNQASYSGEIAFQAISWFTVIGAFGGYQKKGGWSNVTGKKVSYYDESLNRISIEFEILVSPILRIEQHMILPVSGKNINGQWIFMTGISVNFISDRYNTFNE
jgi:hypothetical protein